GRHARFPPTAPPLAANRPAPDYGRARRAGRHPVHRHPASWADADCRAALTVPPPSEPLRLPPPRSHWVPRTTPAVGPGGAGKRERTPGRRVYLGYGLR